jgi:hypothetical protein
MAATPRFVDRRSKPQQQMMRLVPVRMPPPAPPK